MLSICPLAARFVSVLYARLVLVVGYFRCKLRKQFDAEGVRSMEVHLHLTRNENELLREVRCALPNLTWLT